MKVTVRAGSREVEIQARKEQARWRWRDGPAPWSGWTEWAARAESVRAACLWAVEGFWPQP